MALATLEHRDVSQVDRVLERFVRFVTGFAFSIRQPTEIDRMLNVDCLGHCRRPGRIRKDGMADVAIIPNHLARVTNVLAVMTTKTP